MDIAQIPIVDFLKYCKEGARSKGYSWIVCILCRSRDCKYLYKSIERDWQSLDNITGRSMLVLLAGNEVGEHEFTLDADKFYITDKYRSYIKRYNPFATVIGNSGSIESDLSSVRYASIPEESKMVISAFAESIAWQIGSVTSTSLSNTSCRSSKKSCLKGWQLLPSLGFGHWSCNVRTD